MKYYNYHGIIRKKLLEGMLIKYEILEAYNKVKPALVIYFEDGTAYPIREYRWHEYLPVLERMMEDRPH